MDDFTIWLHNKKGIHCWVIPKIYYIKNNSLRFLKDSLTNFIRNERKLGSNEQSLKLAIRNIVKECLNK